MSSSDDAKYAFLTMEDIQTALDILAYYVRQRQRVDAILGQYARQQNRGGSQNMFSPEMVMDAVMKDREAKKAATAEVMPTGEISQEEIDRMKELTAKRKNKNPGVTVTMIDKDKKNEPTQTAT